MNQYPFVFPGRHAVRPAGAPMPSVVLAGRGFSSVPWMGKAHAVDNEASWEARQLASERDLNTLPPGQTPQLVPNTPVAVFPPGLLAHAPLAQNTVLPTRPISVPIHAPPEWPERSVYIYLMSQVLNCYLPTPNSKFDEYSVSPSVDYLIPLQLYNSFIYLPVQSKRFCLTRWSLTNGVLPPSSIVLDDIIWNMDLQAMYESGFILKPFAVPAGSPAIQKIALGEILDFYRVTCVRWVALSPAVQQIMILNGYTTKGLPMYLENLPLLAGETNEGCTRNLIQKYQDQYAKGDINPAEYAPYGQGKQPSTPWDQR